MPKSDQLNDNKHKTLYINRFQNINSKLKVLESIPKRKSFFHSGMLSLFLERQDTRLKSRELTRKKFSCSILCSSKIFILGKYFHLEKCISGLFFSKYLAINNKHKST